MPAEDMVVVATPDGKELECALKQLRLDYGPSEEVPEKDDEGHTVIRLLVRLGFLPASPFALGEGCIFIIFNFYIY